MQRRELWPRDVPVVVVGLQIERVTVSQQARQTPGNGRAIVVVDADVDFHALPHWWLMKRRLPMAVESVKSIVY